MKPIITLIAIVFCLAASCDSSKKAVKDEAALAAAEQLMKDQGFIAATVVLQPQEEGCPVVIKTASEVLDPIDLADDFAVDQLAVWVKFARLRRMNRCSMAGPVSITEIQKKAE